MYAIWEPSPATLTQTLTVANAVAKDRLLGWKETYRKRRVLSKKRIHKSAGIKGRNVFNLLSGTQEANRNAYPVTDCENYATSGGTVDFAKAKAADTNRLREVASLGKSILTACRVQYE